ncbi:hypothetical protein [Microbacterium sp. Se63.02b]|uniref:hypothetical protein n=1 Tax=Microbacterium sp. Se63.02b TaxID=2709304 RepID=UPI0016051F66|nr:hypothetical protein [Microbacterium sp. Se63.02b]QNA92254.1 hypothetical protein G4G29_07375 [Microbacterium sp. Se63.02b]
MPLTPPILTRLTPTAPLLWRDERTLQLGDDGDMRFDADDPWVELLLSRLRSGFRRASFDVIAHATGAPRDAARALLARIAPLLLDDPPTPRPAWIESIGLADGRSEYRMREALADEGSRWSTTAQPTRWRSSWSGEPQPRCSSHASCETTRLTSRWRSNRDA